MTELSQHYRIINPANLEDFANQVNRIFALIADRNDSQEGRRGTPTFHADVDMGGNRATSGASALDDTDLPTYEQVPESAKAVVEDAVNLGLEWVTATEKINVITTAGEGITIDAGGVKTKRKANSGIDCDANGLSVMIKSNGGIGVDVGGIYLADLLGIEKSADPAAPAEGNYIIWMSDGTGKGDDGDILIASTAGGVTNWGTLFDHSAGAAW